MLTKTKNFFSSISKKVQISPLIDYSYNELDSKRKDIIKEIDDGLAQFQKKNEKINYLKQSIAICDILIKDNEKKMDENVTNKTLKRLGYIILVGCGWIANNVLSGWIANNVLSGWIANNVLNGLNQSGKLGIIIEDGINTIFFLGILSFFLYVFIKMGLYVIENNYLKSAQLISLRREILKLKLDEIDSVWRF